MKPLHVGLLVVGAAVAGGLAVRMTQPPPMPATSEAPARRLAPKPATPSVTAPVAPSLAAPAETGPVPAAGAIAAPAVVYQEEKGPAPGRVPVVKGAARPAAVKTAAASSAHTTPVRREAPAAGPQIATVSRPAPYQPTAANQPNTNLSNGNHATGNQPSLESPVPGTEPASPPSAGPAELQPAPEPVEPERQPASALRVSLAQGAPIVVRLDQALTSDRVSAGDTFQASLAEPLVADGYVIAERGARAWGRVVDAHQGGRLGGTSLLELSLSGVQTADGQRIAVSTEPWRKQGDSARNENVAKIGGGAALGAIIGAIAGGGTGAAIGAGVGGAAGTGAAAAARAKPVNLGSETVIQFRLANRVSITERRL